MTSKIAFIVLHFLFLAAWYFFISKRLKYLSDNHVKYTGSDYLKKSYTRLMGVIFLLFVLLFFVTSALIIDLF